MTNTLKQCNAVIALILLASCSGGGGGNGANVDGGGDGGNVDGGGGNDVGDGDGGAGNILPFTIDGDADAVAITAITLNGLARTTGAETSTFDQTGTTLAIGGLSGTLATDGQTVSLDEGGLVTFATGTTSFASRFVAEPQGADRLIGIVGAETAVDNLPGGSATYSGTSELTLLDESDVYALTGDASIEANFEDQTVNTTLDNLAGTVTTGGVIAQQDVTDVATITFTGSGITDAQFEGGTAAISSDILSPLSGSETSALAGAFYGPDADEAGATFIIDDSANGNLTVFGTALTD